MRHRHRTIASFGIAMTVFVILSTLHPVLPYYALGYLFGTCFIHTFVLEDEKETRREELEQLLQVEKIREQELGSARLMAYTDPLTGVKSKNSYDEFVAFLMGDDFKNRDELLGTFNLQIEKNMTEGEAIIACEISEFIKGKDKNYRSIFNRADDNMYKRKKELKGM